jgi:hypothetical protein
MSLCQVEVASNSSMHVMRCYKGAHKDTPHSFRQAKADAFVNRMLAILNDGALALMISIGHRTGHFDLMAILPAVGSVELAARAKLNERYWR